MTSEQQILARMDALIASVNTDILNDIYIRLRTSAEARTELQKGLLALSFGCHLSGNKDAAQHLYDAAGYIVGFGVRAEEDLKLENIPLT